MKLLMSVVFGVLMISSPLYAQSDFREALGIAFPATVSVQTENKANEVGRPIQRFRFGQMGRLDWMNQLATDSNQAGFAVGSNLIATQLPSDIDEVTIKTSDGQQTSGKVVSRDYVTGLTLVEAEDIKLVSLVVGAGVPDAGMPVVITKLDSSGTPVAAAGMIASGLATIDPQLGFTQHLSANMSRSDVGAPVVDTTGVVVGIVGSDADGNLLCLPTRALQGLIDSASGDDFVDSNRGLVGIQFAGGGSPTVRDVTDDSPAEAAGIEAGDEVNRVGDYDVSNSEQVLAAVAMSRAGDEVPITVKRGDETVELTVTLKQHPRQAFAEAGNSSSRVAQQAWELRDGKLVPLEGNDPRFGGLQEWMQGDVEKLLENLPNRNLIFPGLPKQLEGIEIERSELEDSLRDQEEEIEDLKEKLRDLQDKLQDS